ncbi:DNA cytosine methyltransferase [Methylobacterium radiotolerans]|uniref:DNA cytosine methyltransferase n=1 Tax=Methylobacterium radiotolerans TaxID=31998 RepID=UPI00097890D7|nr:DNA methyltransferase [Methylobacterium radiotolerans]
MDSFVDLFAGCGGLSLGFQRAGWKLRFAVEAHPDAFSTYQANLINRPDAKIAWPSWLPKRHYNIVDLISNYRDQLDSLRGSIDLIVGGPPCQGFSTNGRRNPDDPRSQMVMSYLELVSILQPSMVLIENVRGFTSMPYNQGDTFSSHVAAELNRLGYDTWSQLLTASDWGVPQRRPRFILIAVEKGLLRGIDPFQRLRTSRRNFLKNRGLPYTRPITASEAIDDLRVQGAEIVPDSEFGRQGFRQIKYIAAQDPSSYLKWSRTAVNNPPTDMRLPQHTPEVIARFQSILESCPKGRSISPANRQRLGIKKRSTTPMSADLPSPTITTLPDDIIHYSEPRIMTVREHARLQSFPDWFEFRGPYTSGGPQRKLSCSRYTQVGNAVPPLLAEAIAEMLLGLRAPLAVEKHTEGTDVLKMTRHISAQLREVSTG